LVIDPSSAPPAVNYRILVGSVVPRPIAFVSTVSAHGVFNLAPFSFFNAICGDPPTVCFAPGYRVPPKDTLANVMATQEFVVNIVSEEIAEQMNLSSGMYPPEVDEFQVTGLTPVPSDLVRPPRVLESPVSMECRLMQILELSQTEDYGGSLVLGRVVRFHVNDAILDGPRINPDKLRAIGRMSGQEYARTRDRFSLVRPK
jgi:flavin reductase (DIM6/NTAB) family NADH-FMN oxidoreductase RutF